MFHEPLAGVTESYKIPKLSKVYSGRTLLLARTSELRVRVINADPPNSNIEKKDQFRTVRSECRSLCPEVYEGQTFGGSRRCLRNYGQIAQGAYRNPAQRNSTAFFGRTKRSSPKVNMILGEHLMLNAESTRVNTDFFVKIFAGMRSLIWMQ